MALRAVFDDREIDASLAAVCGAYCGACPVYRAWAEQDRPRLEVLARSLGTTPGRLLCTGCRTPAAFCFGGDCEIKGCAEARTRAEAPNLTVPFLVMHGTADRLTDPEGSRELHRLASSPDKTLKLYDGLVHNLLREPEGPTVFADVSAWLEAHANRA